MLKNSTSNNQEIQSNYLDIKFLMQIIVLIVGVIIVFIIKNEPTNYSTPGYLVIISISVSWIYLLITGLIEGLKNNNIIIKYRIKGFYGSALAISIIIILLLLYFYHNKSFSSKTSDIVTISALIMTMSVDLLNRLLRLIFRV